MLKIALSGCCGRMGHVINDIVSGREGMEIVAGFDINTVQYADFPIFADPFEFTGECDVIIDFSNAASTERLLDASSTARRSLSAPRVTLRRSWTASVRLLQRSRCSVRAICPSALT